MGWSDQAELYRADDRKVIESGKSKLFIEEPQTTPDGKTITLLTSKIPLRSSNGEIVGLLGTYIDITDRKNAESKLRESEERFRKLYEDAKIGLYRTTPDGTILMANKALVKMLGYPSFEMLTTRNLEKDGFKPTYQRKEFLEKIEKDGEVNNFESAWMRLDGSVFFVLESAQAIRDPNNNILYFDGVVEDITERKRAETEITMLAQSLKSINESVSITDLEDKILFVNQSFLKTYGYNKNELIGKHIDIVRSLSNPLEFVKEILPATIRGEWQGELLNKRKDGSEFLVYLSTTVIKDKDNKPLGLIGVASDITKRKQMTDELLKLSRAVEQSPVSIIITDTDGNIQYLNPKVTELTGYKFEEVIGKNPRIFSSGEKPKGEYKDLWVNFITRRKTVSFIGNWYQFLQS